jgi:hypothetical protein
MGKTYDYQCPRCLRRMADLKASGQLKHVQGYAQCVCGADLEDERVVKRIWLVERKLSLDDGILVIFDEEPGKRK